MSRNTHIKYNGYGKLNGINAGMNVRTRLDGMNFIFRGVSCYWQDEY